MPQERISQVSWVLPKLLWVTVFIAATESTIRPLPTVGELERVDAHGRRPLFIKQQGLPHQGLLYLRFLELSFSKQEAILFTTGSNGYLQSQAGYREQGYLDLHQVWEKEGDKGGQAKQPVTRCVCGHHPSKPMFQ